MKAGYLFSIAIIPIFLIGTPLMDQKEKGHKENSKGKSEQHGNGGDQGNKGSHENMQKEYHGNQGNKGKDEHWDNNENKAYKWKAEDKWKDEKWDNERFDHRMGKIKGFKRNDWVNERVYNGVRWWDGNNYYDAKGPKGNKKVTLCHKPNGSNYPVTISVSVNALQAHLNHGDYQGECKDFDRTVYSDGYWKNRDTYYNQYYQTTETLSFGEQLLNTAIDVLTNRKAQLVNARPTLTPSQISTREQAIINLQNNVYDLQSSLATGNQRVATINVNF